MWLSAGGAVFALFAVVGGLWQMRREGRRRASVYAGRWGGDPRAVVEAAGPDERDVLRRLRRRGGDEAAAIRLRRVDKDVPFDDLLAAVRLLDTFDR